MSQSVLRKEKLEHVLQAHWAEFLDPVQIMRRVLEHARDTQFKTIQQEQVPPKHTKITVTSFKIATAHDDPGDVFFEVWVEYTIPKGDGVVIGTNTYLLDLHGIFELKECFGTHFLPIA